LPVKVASEWLNSCSGCEIAILNLGETLLAVLPQLEFVHIPVLMDHKYFGQTGEGDTHHLDIPPAVVGLISGGIRNQEHLEVAEAMRILFADTHNVAEGAGAAGLAALLRDRARAGGRSAAFALTGGNVDTQVFARVLAGGSC